MLKIEFKGEKYLFDGEDLNEEGFIAPEYLLINDSKNYMAENCINLNIHAIPAHLTRKRF